MKTIEELGINGLKIIQDDSLYRFTSDSVLLSRFVTIKKNDILADFCSGSGIVGLHTYALNPCLKKVVLFEMQPAMAQMSKESIELNNLQDIFGVENCKLQEIDKRYNEYFSVIVCNPPYEKYDSGIKIEKEEIAVCKKEITLTLPEIVKSAARCLKFGGRFALTHKAERLVDVFFEMRANNIEPKKLSIVYGGNLPYLVMVEGVKGGKSGLTVTTTVKN